ncbi:acyl-CoA dehydrogenase family protein [Simiduia curdlanivorans]|uniref:Acyl-CoA dehydrogenase family protein n=1 Tax=Simiduia curdlanivorans TaxID=1492769 RepID=A0ABV8VA53_9GAMM|nr:acyl-CoA dehydrogenase family protein [Simiduia curdlanivorans]MDN3639650.1 acyl-CoA dehydrogenase family protein [Simiduia curdlanivorans]
MRDHIRLASPHLNDSHQQWRAQLRKFVAQRITPYVEQWEEAGKIPITLWQQAADIGLLQLGFPETYGGVSEGTDIYHMIIAAEELAACGAGGVYATLMVHGIGLPPLLHYGLEPLKQEVIPRVLSGEKHISLAITEPSGGSDVARLQTTAKRDGDIYRVNGSKTFITGGMRANWFTTAVRTGDQGFGGISLLLIDANSAGVSRTKLDKKQGWWCSDTATVYFDNVQVPVSHRIGEENQGFLPIVHNFNNERLGLTASALEFARICFEDAWAWASERNTFGKPLIKHQVIGHKFAEMLRQINATQAYLDNAAWAVKQGISKPADMALLKVQATQTLEFCAREALQILGGAGFIRGNRIERIYREVRVNAIGGGSEEIMRDLAWRQLIGQM